MTVVYIQWKECTVQKRIKSPGESGQLVTREAVGWLVGKDADKISIGLERSNIAGLYDGYTCVMTINTSSIDMMKEWVLDHDKELTALLPQELHQVDSF